MVVQSITEREEIMSKNQSRLDTVMFIAAIPLLIVISFTAFTIGVVGGALVSLWNGITNKESKE